jgi:hypothetical protein
LLVAFWDAQDIPILLSFWAKGKHWMNIPTE